MAIATAGETEVIVDKMDICVAGGVESVSLVQTKELRVTPDPELIVMVPTAYMPMLQTAEVVAKTLWYQPRATGRVSRFSRRGARPQHRRLSGATDDEIVSVATTMSIVNKGRRARLPPKKSRWQSDEGNRPDTSLEGLSALKPVIGPTGFICRGQRQSVV